MGLGGKAHSSDYFMNWMHSSELVGRPAIFDDILTNYALNSLDQYQEMIIRSPSRLFILYLQLTLTVMGALGSFSSHTNADTEKLQ